MCASISIFLLQRNETCTPYHVWVFVRVHACVLVLPLPHRKEVYGLGYEEIPPLEGEMSVRRKERKQRKERRRKEGKREARREARAHIIGAVVGFSFFPHLPKKREEGRRKTWRNKVNWPFCINLYRLTINVNFIHISRKLRKLTPTYTC